MQEIFPEQVQTEPQFFLERLKKPGTMPAPEGGFPHFEGYNVVSVRLREATITATNDPPPAPVDSGLGVPSYGDFYSRGAASEASCAQPVYQQPVYQQPVYQQPVYQQMPQLIGGPKPRKRWLSRDLAIWICVGQLAVIIWWLVGPGMEKQRQVATKIVQHTIKLPEFPSFFSKGAAKATKQKSVSRSGKKVRGKGFIPPPPPEVSALPGKMFVPPPPVAYSLPSGAAAASTLPPAHKAAVKEEALPVPAEHASTASIVPVADTTISSSEPPASETPDWLQKVPSYNWHDALNDVPPQKPMKPLSQEIDEIPMPAVESHPQPQRTVMQGNRKRIITDR